MTITIVSWFVLGFLAGMTILAIAAIIAINCEGRKRDNEEFVKKLVDKEGWTEARWKLEIAFNGKYMRTWRRLYKKHIEEEQKDGE